METWVMTGADALYLYDWQNETDQIPRQVGL